MLKELGIFSMSPELGIDTRSAESFFIGDKRALQVVIVGNAVWVDNMIKLMFEKVTCVHLSSEVTHVDLAGYPAKAEYATIETELSCQNHGLLESPLS